MKYPRAPKKQLSDVKARRMLLAALLTGCSLTEPIAYELPDPDPSLDPAALVAPILLYGCGEWLNGPRPSDKKILIDLSFVRPTLSDPEDRPTSMQLDVLKKHGGEVLYTFHFPAVRAWIATDEIPGLSNESSVSAIFRVTNPRRYDWKSFVGYRAPYSYIDGASKYESLGGRVDGRFSSINAIAGLAPDQSAAIIRRDSNVEYVESAAIIPNCF